MSDFNPRIPILTNKQAESLAWWIENNLTSVFVRAGGTYDGELPWTYTSNKYLDMIREWSGNRHEQSLTTTGEEKL